jgi:hypothetical protein
VTDAGAVKLDEAFAWCQVLRLLDGNVLDLDGLGS